MTNHFMCMISRVLIAAYAMVFACVSHCSPDFTPSAFSHRYGTTSGNENDAEEIDLGTTLVAIKFAGGVVVGADTRTSTGGYVSNKLAYKINPVFDTDDELQEENVDDNAEAVTPPSFSSCVICRSGSAADTQWLANQAKQRFRIRRLERPGYRPSISEVAHFLRYQMRNSQTKGSSLQASLICAGYNAATCGGQIFGITPGGSLWEERNFCVSGSGSTILLGYLDDALQNADEDFSKEYSEEEAIELVTKLLRLSIARDGSSGGLVRLYSIDRNGLKERTVYPFMNLPSHTTLSEVKNDAKAEKTISTSTRLKGFASPVSKN